MNPRPIPSRLTALVLLFIVQFLLRADGTNLVHTLPHVISNSTTTNKPTIAERRAIIEAWRAERGGTNRTAIAPPPENTRQLPLAERRARLRVKITELRQKKTSGALTAQEQTQLNYLETHQPPAPSPANVPVTNSVIQK